MGIGIPTSQSNIERMVNLQVRNGFAYRGDGRRTLPQGLR